MYSTEIIFPQEGTFATQNSGVTSIITPFHKRSANLYHEQTFPTNNLSSSTYCTQMSLKATQLDCRLQVISNAFETLMKEHSLRPGQATSVQNQERPQDPWKKAGAAQSLHLVSYSQNTTNRCVVMNHRLPMAHLTLGRFPTSVSRSKFDGSKIIKSEKVSFVCSAFCSLLPANWDI